MGETYYLIKIDLPDYSVFDDWLKRHNIEYRKVMDNKIVYPYTYDPDVNYSLDKTIKEEK